MHVIQDIPDNENKILRIQGNAQQVEVSPFNSLISFLFFSFRFYSVSWASPCVSRSISLWACKIPLKLAKID